MIEQVIDYSTILAVLPFVAITINQVKAIHNRDNHRCIFPSQHDCHGKLAIHHINGKEDTPENLLTVCHEAHWEYIHNGASEEQKSIWENEFSSIAQEKTVNAINRGWIFPNQ